MKMHIATIPASALKVQSRSAYYSGQKRLFFLVVIMLSMAPLIVISLMSFHFYKKSWMEKTSMELLSLADSRKDMVEIFLYNQENLLGAVLEIYSPQYLTEPGNLERVFSALNKNGVIVDLGVIDSVGNHRAYVGPYTKVLSDKNYLGAEWFKETVRKGRYVSDIFRGFRDEPHIIVAVTDQAREWILRATVNSEYFSSLMTSAEVGAGGDAYIVNGKGEPQTPSRFGAAKAIAAAGGTLASYEGPATFSDDRFIYATSPLKDGDWILVLKTDLNASLSEFYSARNREMVHVLLAAMLILAVAGVLVGYLMNRIERADHQRMKMNNRLLEVEKMALVGRLAASVAHEINNPLQVIDDQAGWIFDLLEDEKGVGLADIKEYRDSADKIRAHVKRARTITHKLLGLSRAGEDDRTEADLNQLISETVSFLEKEANRNRIVIRMSLAEHLPTIVTVLLQLQQVFLNIINNSIEAIRHDGVITINTRSNGDGTVVAEFADSGPGMTEEVRQRIFDPFFSTKKGGDNTGLGLSISYNIVERLGGRIQARNGNQGGCVFAVILPVSKSMGK